MKILTLKEREKIVQESVRRIALFVQPKIDKLIEQDLFDEETVKTLIVLVAFGAASAALEILEPEIPFNQIAE